MRKLKLGLLMSVVAALLAVGLPAYACSCVTGDPRDELAAANGAFIGELVSQEPDPNDQTMSTYTFRVLEAVKGKFEKTEEVHSATDGSACGLEMDPGERTGLFLYRNTSGQWTSSLCGRISPESLREAAKPLPKPDGKGEPRLFVGGSFGKARVMALNAAGKTLDYGFGGNQDVMKLDRCPGSQRTVEVAQTYNEERERWRIAVASRSVSSTKELQETVARFLWKKHYRYFWPGAVSCQNKDATKSVLFVTQGYGVYTKSALAYLQKGEITSIVDTTAREAAFGDGIVYLTAGKYGRKIVSFKLDGAGAVKQTIVQAGRQLGDLALSADGTMLAAIQAAHCGDNGCDPAKLVLIRLGSGKVTKRILKHAGGSHDLAWWGSRRIVVTGLGKGTTVHTYNLAFRRLGAVKGWDAQSPVVLEGRLYGLSLRKLVSAKLPDGATRGLGRLPSPVTNALTTVR